MSGFSIDEAREPYKLGLVPVRSKTAQLIGFRASGASRLVPFHGGYRRNETHKHPFSPLAEGLGFRDSSIMKAYKGQIKLQVKQALVEIQSTVKRPAPIFLRLLQYLLSTLCSSSH